MKRKKTGPSNEPSRRRHHDQACYTDIKQQIFLPAETTSKAFTRLTNKAHVSRPCSFHLQERNISSEQIIIFPDRTDNALEIPCQYTQKTNNFNSLPGKGPNIPICSPICSPLVMPKESSTLNPNHV